MTSNLIIHFIIQMHTKYQDPRMVRFRDSSNASNLQKRNVCACIMCKMTYKKNVCIMCACAATQTVMLSHINLIISFLSPSTPPFCLPLQDIAPLLAECSYPAPYKVSIQLEQPKKTESEWIQLSSQSQIKHRPSAPLFCSQEDEQLTIKFMLPYSCSTLTIMSYKYVDKTLIRTRGPCFKSDSTVYIWLILITE